MFDAEERRKTVEKIKDDAREHGVADCEAAIALLIEVEATPPPALSDEARYVELDMLIASDGDMVKHKALPTALQLGGNVGIHLFRRANDDAVKSKLQKKRANLRIKLELDLFEELDSDKHAKGMKELKEHVLRRLHYQVEQQIFKRKLILVEKEQVDSGKNSTKIAKRLRSSETIIGDLLAVIYNWEVIDSDEDPEVLSEQTFRDACNGKVAWRTSDIGSNGDEASQRHYGQLYRTEVNQLQRTIEEQSILQIEAVRLVNGVEEKIERVTAAKSFLAAKWESGQIQEEVERGQDVEQNQEQQEKEQGQEQQQQLLPAEGSVVDPTGWPPPALPVDQEWQRAVDCGKITMLEREIQRLEGILEDAIGLTHSC